MVYRHPKYDEIHALRAEGKTYQAIGEALDVPKATVQYVLTRG